MWKAEQEARDRYRQRHQHGFSDPYEVLGLHHGAGKAEIRKAWAKMCKEHHPDLHGGDGARLKAINAAYEALKGRRR